VDATEILRFIEVQLSTSEPAYEYKTVTVKNK
jgi:hypothetical protein